MTHEELMQLIMGARTDDEVMRARVARDSWIEEHPRASEAELDMIYEGSESLEMHAEAIHRIQNGEYDA